MRSCSSSRWVPSSLHGCTSTHTHRMASVCLPKFFGWGPKLNFLKKRKKVGAGQLMLFQTATSGGSCNCSGCCWAARVDCSLCHLSPSSPWVRFSRYFNDSVQRLDVSSMTLLSWLDFYLNLCHLSPREAGRRQKHYISLLGSSSRLFPRHMSGILVSFFEM